MRGWGKSEKEDWMEMEERYGESRKGMMDTVG
jgi:hypothetical protein